MRILIADDEAPLRHWLRRLLAERAPWIDVAGEAANGNEALDMLRALRPDAAFLDIRMPGLSGLEVAAQAGNLCRMVFVTAYDEFAVNAFEQAATDYLLKPVTPERLDRTLERLRSPMAPDAAGLMQSLLDRLEAPVASGLRWLRVGSDESTQLVDVRQVDYFKAADKYTEVHQGTSSWLVRISLSELEKQLAPDEFWRIHRSLVVRVQAIAEARRDLMGRLWVHLRDGAVPLPVSQAHACLFRRH